MAFAPWDALPVTGKPAVSPPADLPDFLLAAYQRHGRAPQLPGEGCRFRPTCSAYAREAFERWKVLGVIWTADRLLVRESAGMDGGYLPACRRPGADPTDEGLHDPVP